MNQRKDPVFFPIRVLRLENVAFERGPLTAEEFRRPDQDDGSGSLDVLREHINPGFSYVLGHLPLVEEHAKAVGA
jgi:hypothetical protein